MLIPVANKPVIYYAIESMKEAGIKEIGFVVSENRRELEPVLGNGKKWGMKFSYITQDKQNGIAHAVLCAEDYIDGEDFVLYLGDNLVEEGVKGLVDIFVNGKANAAISVTPVPEPQHFGVAVVKNGKIESLVEKPKKPKSNLAVCGIYVFDKNVFKAAKSIEPSARGELEITDTISKLITTGRKVLPHVLEGWWRDTGQKADMIEANQAVMEGIKTDIRGRVDESSRIEGRVVLEKGSIIKNSIVRGPAVIGEKSKISNSYIGPYSSIGDEVDIQGSEVENSIVMSGTTIKNVGRRIESSLIGNNAVLSGGSTKPKSLSVVLGDLCRLEID